MVDRDIFTAINNAVIDLQSSDIQGFERPLKTLVRLLNSAPLADVNKRLCESVDFDALVEASEQTQGSMAGSAKFLWPEAEEDRLGATLILLNRFAANPQDLIGFGLQYHHNGNHMSNSLSAVVRNIIIPFCRDYKAYVLADGLPNDRVVQISSTKVFVVHGHDEAAKEAIARQLERYGLEAIILHEQASGGRTVMEKIENSGDVGFAVVLLTPDDVGRSINEDELKGRARQNVVLELGYFIGRLSRSRVCAFRKGGCDIPSDFAGVVWTEMDALGHWRLELGRELKAAGFAIDLNRAMA